jgi:hypothetical protein
MSSIPPAGTLPDPTDFSLVLGGPLYQMFRRAHLSGPSLELLRRRILVISFVAWVPLAVLSAMEGHLLGSGRYLSFLSDIESHVRLLVTLPLLILAELVVHRRIRPMLNCFVERDVVPPADRPRFYAAIDAAMRARNSLSLEVALAFLTFTVGQWVWRSRVASGAATWYAVNNGTALNLTLAGRWYCFVSVPICQFIILRWYLRLVILFLLLWRVSRLNLRLMPTHPDRAGGIGFLSVISEAFAPIVFAQGALLAGLMATRIFYQGNSLMSFKLSILTLVGFFVLAILGPLTMFTPHLLRARRTGLIEFGTLATVYVAGFDEKWLRGGARGEEILGTGDIQSLADLANSYAVVRGMRLMPFGLEDLVLLGVAALLPILPLVLTVVPLDELLARLIKTAF